MGGLGERKAGWGASTRAVLASAGNQVRSWLPGVGPGPQAHKGPELPGFPGSHSAVVCCPANPTLHIPLLDRSRKKVTMQGPMCFSFQADAALLDA